MKVIEQVSKLLDTNKVYLVGGSVRDILMGKTPKDYDFCTLLLPDEIESCVRKAKKKPYLVGKRFGTVGCKFEIGGKQEIVEITTFRNETYTYGSRKPVVSYSSSLDEDLSRRDFTINAMAIKPNGTVHDPFDGKSDIKNNMIRCVGKPKDRFREDPLRILRAVRFQSVLGFDIAGETLAYMDKMKYEIYNVSKERWVIELDKLLCGKYVRKSLETMMNTGLIKIIFPELSLQYKYNQNSPHHRFDLWEHTLQVVEAIPSEELNLRWVGLLHDIGKPFTRTDNKKGYCNYINHELVGAEISTKISDYLKFSNERKIYLYETIKNHLNNDSPLKGYDNGAK